MTSLTHMSYEGFVHVASAFSATFTAILITNPSYTLKTRYQVMASEKSGVLKFGRKIMFWPGVPPAPDLNRHFSLSSGGAIQQNMLFCVSLPRRAEDM